MNVYEVPAWRSKCSCGWESRLHHTYADARAALATHKIQAHRKVAEALRR